MSDDERNGGTGGETSDEPSLLGQICDIVRYAPIAILLDGPSLLPKLAEQGKVHMGNARVLGRRAVRQAEPQARRLLQGLGEQAGDLLKVVGLVPPDDDEPPAPRRPPRAARTAEPVAVDTAAARHGNGDTPGPAVAGPAVEELAIPDYDSLSASHVVNRLPGLTSDELEAVRAYEAAHRGRKTILNKVAQLQQST